MNKVKVLSLLCVGLVLTNLLLLWFLFNHGPKPPGGEGPRNIIIEKLGFDKEQSAAYDKLIKRHQADIDSAQQQMMTLKNSLYASLQRDQQESLRDSLILEINKVQMNIENIHYNHFLDIKGLCKPEQQQAFNALTADIAKLFSPRPPKRRE
jgi:hypothetical protein